MRNEAHFSPRAIQAFTATGFTPGLVVRASAGDAPAEIMIYDAIGDDGWGGGVSASAIIAALKPLAGAPVKVRINSPGGSVFDGLAMYNALLAHTGEVTCQIDGVAASAASFIACAGTKTVMASTSMMMIHNARSFSYGDARDAAAMAELLSKIDGQLSAIYAAKSGIEASVFAGLMDAETWMTAEEAQAQGLADSVLAKPAASAKALSTEVLAAVHRRLRLHETEA